MQEVEPGVGVGDQQQQKAQIDQPNREQRDGHGPQHRFRIDAPPERHHLAASAHHAPGAARHDIEGAGLDAAARRAGVSPDEHQGDGQEEGGRAHQFVVEGVEPSGARRHALKKAGEQLAAQGQRAEGARIVPLQQPEDQRPHHEQRGHGAQHDLALHQQAVMAAVLQVRHDVDLHQKAHAPQDDERRDHQADQRVGDVVHQAVREYRKARVAKGHDRVVHAQVQAPAPAELRHET